MKRYIKASSYVDPRIADNIVENSNATRARKEELSEVNWFTSEADVDLLVNGTWIDGVRWPYMRLRTTNPLVSVTDIDEPPASYHGTYPFKSYVFAYADGTEVVYGYVPVYDDNNELIEVDLNYLGRY